MAIAKTLQKQMQNITRVMGDRMIERRSDTITYNELCALFWTPEQRETAERASGIITGCHSRTKRMPLGNVPYLDFERNGFEAWLSFHAATPNAMPNASAIRQGAPEELVRRLHDIVAERIETSREIKLLVETVEWLTTVCSSLAVMRYLFPQTVYILRRCEQPDLAQQVEKINRVPSGLPRLEMWQRKDIRQVSHIMTREMLLDDVGMGRDRLSIDAVEVYLSGSVPQIYEEGGRETSYLDLK